MIYTISCSNKRIEYSYHHHHHGYTRIFFIHHQVSCTYFKKSDGNATVGLY